MTLTRLLVLLMVGLSLTLVGTTAQASNGGDCAYAYPDPSVNPDECLYSGSGGGSATNGAMLM